MLLSIILFLTSIILYILSPDTYNISFILLDLSLFLVGTLNLFRNSRGSFNVLSFNFIFLLSFFFCTYSYALFVIGAGVEFSMTIFSFTDFNFITKAVGLSTIAITAYFCSYSYQQRKPLLLTNIQTNGNIQKIKLVDKIRSLFFLSVVANFLYFTLIKGGNSYSITSASFLPELYKLFLILYLILNSIRCKIHCPRIIDVIKCNKKAIFEAFIICLLYLLGGDRGLPISIVFIFLGVYSFFYRKIRIAQFALIALVGVVSLFALRVTRGGENSLVEGGVSAVTSTTREALSGQSAILLFSDLMGASAEMCLGYEYVQKYGLTSPEKIFLVPLQPIPFLPSLFGRLFFGKVPYEMSAGYILNEYIGNSYGYASSLGNHIVIDTYMHWGLIGVIILFILFGRCISYFDSNKYSNIFIASSFIIILSFALYLPRDSVFTILRPIAFLWFICTSLKLTRKAV